MIRLMGLVELPPIVEETEEPTKEPETTDAKKADPSVIAAKLNKLKGMDLNPDQTKKVDEMLAKMETLTAKQQQLDVDKDGEIEADDLEKLRGEKDEEELKESAPEGWEKTVLAMKKHKEIDNPFALAHWMKKKGYHSQKESTE